jgi:hypothetical protein
VWRGGGCFGKRKAQHRQLPLIIHPSPSITPPLLHRFLHIWP